MFPDSYSSFVSDYGASRRYRSRRKAIVSMHVDQQSLALLLVSHVASSTQVNTTDICPAVARQSRILCRRANASIARAMRVLVHDTLGLASPLPSIGTPIEVKLEQFVQLTIRASARSDSPALDSQICSARASIGLAYAGPFLGRTMETTLGADLPSRHSQQRSGKIPFCLRH